MGAASQAAERPEDDQELLRAASSLIGDVTSAFEALAPATACTLLAGFIDALANRYLPRAERRLAADGAAADQEEKDRAAAAETLRECLDVLTRLMAPAAPFITDEVGHRLRALDQRAAGRGLTDLAAWPALPPAAS